MNDGTVDHSDALLREAAHRLVDTIAPYRVLTRGNLADLSGISQWNPGEFDRALRWAVDHDLLRRLDDDLYEIAPGAGRDGGKRLPVEGGW